MNVEHRTLNIEPWSPLAPPKAGKHRMWISLRSFF